MIKVAALLTLVVILASCSDNPSNPANTTLIVPKTGSIFVMEEFKTDTTTGAPIDSTRDTVRYEVTQSGITLQGKSNVAVFSQDGDSAGYGPRFSYESNGDVGMFMQNSPTGSGIWVIFPIQSRTSATITIMDTTYTLGPLTVHSTNKVKTEYIGTGTVTVKGQVINVVQVRMTTTSSVSAGLTSNETVSSGDFYFAPSLGFYAKGTSSPPQVPGMKKLNGGMSTLVEYELK